jgi:hypothetical protein
VPILLWLIFWAVMGTPAVNPPGAWFIGLVVATVLTLYALGSTGGRRL